MCARGRYRGRYLSSPLRAPRPPRPDDKPPIAIAGRSNLGNFHSFDGLKKTASFGPHHIHLSVPQFPLDHFVGSHDMS